MDCVCGVVYYHTFSSIIRLWSVPLYPITYVNGWEYRKIICFNDNDASKVISAIKEKLLEENRYKDEKSFKRGIRDSSVFEELEVNNIGEDGLFRAQTFFMSDILEKMTPN